MRVLVNMDRCVGTTNLSGIVRQNSWSSINFEISHLYFINLYITYIS